MSDPDAREAAMRYYVGSSRSFLRDVANHACHEGGVIIWQRDLVLLARPVCRSWPANAIIEPSSKHESESFDSWFIHLLCGEMAALNPLKTQITQYPHVIFQRGARNSRLHIVSTKSLVKHI